MGKEHSEDYDTWINSLEWKAKSRSFRAATKQCCLFPWKKATCSHHVYYGNMGHEWLVRDCVPLSHEAHLIVHQNQFWNLNGNPKTPSELRPYVSNYLRAIAVILVMLYPVTTILSAIVQATGRLLIIYAETEPPKPKLSKPKLRKR